MWPEGSRVTAQHDGAKSHTEEAVKGTIEDSSTAKMMFGLICNSHRTLQTPISGILVPSMPTRRSLSDLKLSPTISRE